MTLAASASPTTSVGTGFSAVAAVYRASPCERRHGTTLPDGRSGPTVSLSRVPDHQHGIWC